MNMQPRPGQIQPRKVGEPSRATIPALALAVAEWFPELKGRALPVSEAKITRENMPKLPLCMVSLLREMGNHIVQTGRIEPQEFIVVEFWFEPTRYTNGKGGETPFWAFYDYDLLRDRLVTQLKNWISPRGDRLEYFSLEIDSDQYATVITFNLRHKFVFCALNDGTDEACAPDAPLVGVDGELINPDTFLFSLCKPNGFCAVIEDELTKDPCPPNPNP